MSLFLNTVEELVGTTGFQIVGDDTYENIVWELANPPTKDAVESLYAQKVAEYDAQAYARSRAPEYPPIGDQLDALFKAGVFPAEMAAAIQAVKYKYPKGQV